MHGPLDIHTRSQAPHQPAPEYLHGDLSRPIALGSPHFSPRRSFSPLGCPQRHPHQPCPQGHPHGDLSGLHDAELHGDPHGAVLHGLPCALPHYHLQQEPHGPVFCPCNGRRLHSLPSAPSSWRPPLVRRGPHHMAPLARLLTARELGIRVLESGMLTPLRSTLGLFPLTHDTELASSASELSPCTTCGATACAYRRAEQGALPDLPVFVPGTES